MAKKAKKTNPPQTLPGSPSGEKRVERAIRVNHAGEYGAKQIYAGQLAVLKRTDSEKLIRHMAEQEDVHLKYFDEQMQKRQVRPTAFMPVWHVLGYALGAGTALLGKKAAMACTVAVEEVIDEHYRHQLDEIDEKEKDLKAHIKKFREEELEHRDIGIQNEAEQAPAYALLTAAVKTSSRIAIWLSKRI